MSAGMTGDWAGLSRMLGTVGSPLAWNRAKKKAVLKEAHRLRGIMIRSFNAGGPPGKRWKRLSVFTQLVSRAQGKGDRRPLMDTGDLRNSHSVVEENDDTTFVGIHRSTKAKATKGKKKPDPVDLGSLHEHGSKPIYIRVTPKMRRFFLWLHKKTMGQIKPLRASTIAVIVRIPARPWIGPIWEAEQDNAAKNIMEDTVKNLGLPGFAALVR